MPNTGLLAQGRIVINEFMPWSGCNSNSEFVELKNFGPGPINIGCYIITNGQYSVTIPPNTVLVPGQFYLIAGHNTLEKNCGNNDSLVNVNLNWSTCNCTNTIIPTIGDGFFADGGNANEKVVLLDANLNVVDAVSRSLPASASVSIITSPVGGCTPKTFNLGQMSVSYEATNSSTGVNNSFARKVDGDCGWVKTTAISAKAPNKTGSTASSTYDFSSLSASECGGSTGSISIQVNASDVSALFPMNYTLAFDVDGNGVFDANDSYTYGTDNSSPSIDIQNLAYGRYRITVSSSAGCNLKNFDFFIFNCYGIVLSSTLQSFTYKGVLNGKRNFECIIDGTEIAGKIWLQARQGNVFKSVHEATFVKVGSKRYSITAPVSAATTYRLKIVSASGETTYSSVVQIPNSSRNKISLFPNPASNEIQLQFYSAQNRTVQYKIIDLKGMVADIVLVKANRGDNFHTIDIGHLPSGMYQLMGDEYVENENPLRFYKK